MKRQLAGLRRIDKLDVAMQASADVPENGGYGVI
jgi:hypothetical protein